MPCIHLGTIDRVAAAADQYAGRRDCPAFSTVTLTLTDHTGDLALTFYADPEIGRDLADAINAVLAKHRSPPTIASGTGLRVTLEPAEVA